MATRDQQPTGTRTRIRIESSGINIVRHVLRLVVIAASLLLGATLDSRPASAQPVCGDRTDILKNLAKIHSERPQAMGLSADGQVIEVLVSSTGSWTILVTYPSRLTCLVADGESWETLISVASGPSA